MLVQDTAAFIEQLEVQEIGRRARKRRVRVTHAEVDVLRAELQTQRADDALRKLASELAIARELDDARGERSLVHEMTMLRARLRAARHDLHASRARLERLERAASSDVERERRARIFRLHSARHYLEFSERRFVRLAALQFERPMLVAKRDGRRWWWYLDRFWWDDEGLSARDVAALVTRGDRERTDRAAEVARTRASLFGEVLPPDKEETFSPIVRFAVWCRDRGRCVDCRSLLDLEYVQIIPYSRGGSRWIKNVELRCAECRARRQRNTARTEVSRARIESAGFRR
jgi:multidrug efflux pump subunit AcrA (membrane-fusion protein)